MAEEELSRKIDEQGKKLDEIYVTVRKLNNYFRWTFILTIVFFILPLIGLAFVIPWFLKTLPTSANIPDFKSLGL